MRKAQPTTPLFRSVERRAMASAMVAIGFLCASTAEAAFIIYTDRASWELGVCAVEDKIAGDLFR